MELLSKKILILSNVILLAVAAYSYTMYLKKQKDLKELVDIALPAMNYCVHIEKELNKYKQQEKTI